LDFANVKMWISSAKIGGFTQGARVLLPQGTAESGKSSSRPAFFAGSM
jgi:hypothetical protein